MSYRYYSDKVLSPFSFVNWISCTLVVELLIAFVKVYEAYLVNLSVCVKQGGLLNLCTI